MFTCSRIIIFSVIFFVLCFVCCVTLHCVMFTFWKSDVWNVCWLWCLRLWAATLCSNICQSTSYRMSFVQQKYWNLVVCQQERGSGSWWGSQRSAWTPSAEAAPGATIVSVSGLEKSLGMPGYWICIILVKSSSQKSCKKLTTLRIQLLHEPLLQNTIININSFIIYRVVAP